MAVKFIDRNRRSEVLGDEIVARCSCGCGFVTVSVTQEQDYSGKKKFAVLNILHSGSNIMDKKSSIAQEMLFVNPKIICAIKDLVNCEVNSGNGIIEDECGRVLLIDHSGNETIGETLCLAGFYNEKSFRKYMKNPQKNIKYLAWNIVLENKEMNKFAEVFNKILQKEFYNEVCEKDGSGSCDKKV